ncbi:MAG: CinA family nicotinamide mononucleotide deamidase-related protein [Verrucomicrobiota bacterium]
MGLFSSLSVELITTGSELLIDRLNTHVVFLGQSLQTVGLTLSRHTTVGDGQDIEQVLKEALERADIVLVTGGLGPTSDDLTRDYAAALLRRPLQHRLDIEETIRTFFKERKLNPPQTVYRQAQVPEGARVLDNPHGTAPGLHLTTEKGGDLFLLPGPPRELKPMWTDLVLPFLKSKVGDQTPPFFHELKLSGIGESEVQERAEHPLHSLAPGIEIAYCAAPRQVSLRLLHSDAALLERALAFVRGEFGRSIYAENGETIETVVVRMAIEKHVWLATAESCTGGLIAHRITNIPGASQIFDRGWVTYTNEAKEAQLGVPSPLIATHGAVSGPVAESMARGVIERSPAHIAVSTTGIAGPSGGSPGKPVGLVYLGLAFRGNQKIHVRSIKKYLVPERETFKNMASHVALELIRRRLLNWKSKPQQT